ncbi:MAG: LysR family transcriptional regulator [Gammaproteobacteria bacterium]|nr:LysR family transcriptional regulator [Gammaproteobacteria bacterium]MCP5196103.1 LysR family transcriptional regulator [Gammaproteobacteria bacterium]
MRTFLTVVNTGSFTAAADRLGVSKALASKYLNQLEQRLGVRLLNRTTRHLSLTEVGQVYYTRCQPLLEAIDELEAAIQDRHAFPRGHLTLTAPQTFGERSLAPVIAAFLEQYPQVTVALQLTDRFVNLLEEGVDVGVRIGELADSRLVARRLATIRMATYAAPRYLERHGTPVHPRELGAHTCVIDTNVDVPTRWLYGIEGESQAVDVQGPFHANSASAVRELAIAGVGIGRSPAYAIADAVRDGRLRVLLQPYETVEYGLYAVYPHRRYLAAKVRAFIEFLAGRFGEPHA